VLLTHGVRPPRARFKPTVAEALASVHNKFEEDETPAKI
jgi:hypothetical protein